MKSPRCLFHRKFVNGVPVSIDGEVAPKFQWVLDGEGVAVEKIDGMCCAIIGGELYRAVDRRSARGRGPDVVDPDRIRKRWKVWAKASAEYPEDEYLVKAYENTPWCREDGTYEAVGPHFKGNPYCLDADFLEKHGRIKHYPERTFEGIRQYLEEHEIEGLIFYRGREIGCQITRQDFGIPWPVGGRSHDWR